MCLFIEMNFEVGIWSPQIMFCCRACGHEDDFVADLSQLDELEDSQEESSSWSE